MTWLGKGKAFEQRVFPVCVTGLGSREHAGQAAAGVVRDAVEVGPHQSGFHERVMSLDCILGHEDMWQVSEEQQDTLRRVAGNQEAV